MLGLTSHLVREKLRPLLLLGSGSTVESCIMTSLNWSVHPHVPAGYGLNVPHHVNVIHGGLMVTLAGVVSIFTILVAIASLTHPVSQVFAENLYTPSARLYLLNVVVGIEFVKSEQVPAPFSKQ